VCCKIKVIVIDNHDGAHFLPYFAFIVITVASGFSVLLGEFRWIFLFILIHVHLLHCKVVQHQDLFYPKFHVMKINLCQNHIL
jgi:hypothetical protein